MGFFDRFIKKRAKQLPDVEETNLSADATPKVSNSAPSKEDSLRYHKCAFCDEVIKGSPKVKDHEWWCGECSGTRKNRKNEANSINKNNSASKIENINLKSYEYKKYDSDGEGLSKKYKEEDSLRYHKCAFCDEVIKGSPKVKDHEWWCGECSGTRKNGKSKAETRKNRKNEAEKAVQDSERLLQKAKSMNVSVDEALLKIAKNAFFDGKYQHITQMCENFNKTVLSTLKEKKNEAEKAVQDSEQLFQKAKSMNISVEEALLKKAKSSLLEEKYSDTIQLCEDLHKKIVPLLKEMKNEAEKAVQDSEQLLQKAKSMNVSVEEALLKKARNSLIEEKYLDTIQLCEKFIKKYIRLLQEKKDEAEKMLHNSERLFDKAKSYNLSPDQSFLLKAKQCFENEKYTEAIQRCNSFSNQVESLINRCKPSISINFCETSLKLNSGRKTQIKLKNAGNIPAKDFTLKCEGEANIRVLSNVNLLNPEEETSVDVWIKPEMEGDLPLDIRLTYKDDLDRDYEEKKLEFIEVASNDSTTGSSSGDNITPRRYFSGPMHSSGFPSEMALFYSEPQFIGKGGFGQVFRVKRKDGDVVALKLLSNLDVYSGKSFLREVSAWQRLTHENIISLKDMNIVPVPYLELEYAGGGTLESLSKPLNAEIASKLIFEISEGLKHAHENDIVHRDLKPQNILLTKYMTPKITDWGLSKVMAESKTSSRVGLTPKYAAPEQIAPKKFGHPDHRTDIYQLGVVFYELVTGRLPFNGGDFSEIGFAIISEDPEPPSVLNPACSELDSIIMKCLNKKPEDRYQSMYELQIELAVFLKMEYTRSLSMSAGNLNRSCIYCGDLVFINAKIGDAENALKYAIDMKNYASQNFVDDVEDIIKNLNYVVERKIEIGRDLMSKIGVVLHQVKMGR